MNVQATLEVLHTQQGSEQHMRLVALELGGALGRLEDAELARLDSGLARLQGISEEASSWVQGFCSALSALLSGAQQQRRQERERRSELKGMEELQRSLRKDWRSLLSAMGTGLIRPGELESEVGMDRSQVSRNLRDMVKTGLLERVPVREQPEAQDGRARLYRLTRQGRWLVERLTLHRTPIAQPTPAPCQVAGYAPAAAPSPAAPPAELRQSSSQQEPRGPGQTTPTLPVSPQAINGPLRRRTAPRASLTAIDSTVLTRPAPPMMQGSDSESPLIAPGGG